MSNVIHPSFQHGANFKIGNFCVIEEDVIVGDNVTIENYVLLRAGTTIGNGVFVDSYVRSSGNNKIKDNVTLRYGCTIAKQVTVCNDTFVSPNVMTIYSTHEGKVAPGTVIGERTHIGTAAVIGPGVTIGADVVIGAMAYVSKDCLDPGIYVGVPARLKKKFEPSKE